MLLSWANYSATAYTKAVINTLLEQGCVVEFEKPETLYIKRKNEMMIWYIADNGGEINTGNFAGYCADSVPYAKAKQFVTREDALSYNGIDLNVGDFYILRHPLEVASDLWQIIKAG